MGAMSSPHAPGTPPSQGAIAPRHLALLVLGVVAVSFSGVLAREAHAPALTISFYRTAMALVVLLPLALWRHGAEVRGLTRRQWGIAMLAGAFLAAHFATWISSLSYTTVAASVLIVTTSPIWIELWGRIGGERLPRAALGGIALALLWTLIVTGGDFRVSGGALLGDGLALAGAVFAAAYLVSGRSLRREVSLLTYVAIVYTTCAALLAAAMGATSTPFTGFPARTWAIFALITIGPQILGHTVFNYLLAHVQAAVVAIAVMAEPVGATILAAMILGENPSVSELLGGAVILAGVYLAIGVQARGAVEVPIE